MAWRSSAYQTTLYLVVLRLIDQDTVDCCIKRCQLLSLLHSEPFWLACRYLEGVLYPFLYTGSAYNGSYYGGQVLGVAYLAGPVRLGTLRVKQQPCVSASGIHYAAPPVCHGAWSSSEEDLSAFGLGGVYKANRDSSEPSFVSTVTTHRYPSPAFNVVLPLNESTGAAALTGP